MGQKRPPFTFRYQTDRLGVARSMLEEDKAERPLPYHCPRFVDGVGVFQVSLKRAPISFQNFADQEEVFFLGSDEKNAQGWRSEGDFGCG
jgi:hypothetical protein